MAYIQLNDKQITLRAGEMTIGCGATADIRLEGPDGDAPVAVVASGATDTVVRRARPDAVVKVNGVTLGVEPTPLIHGDRIETQGQVLIFGDAAKGGSTAYFSGANLAEMIRQRESQGGASGIASPSAPPARVPTANTGGRLVSLTDGREYEIVRKPFTIGRDPACDVVIASGDVSRSHAEIESGKDGYYLIDTSTNGVLVNGKRVDGTLTLARGDVIRLGPEEFRFYADKVSAAAPASAAASGGAPAPSPVPMPAPMATPAPATPPAPAPAPTAPVASPSGRPVLATLEIADTSGMRSEDFTEALVQVGRGKHNDVVLALESVSDSHAKFQRRADGWYVVDMGSTNGTFVGGARVAGELPLGDASDVRFGAVQAKFRVAGVSATAAGEVATATVGDGRTAVLSSADAARLAAAARAAKPAAPASPTPAEPAPVAASAAKSGGIPGWVWIVVALVVGGGAFFFLQGR